MPEYEKKEVEEAIAKIKSLLAAKLQIDPSARVADICLSDDEKFIIYSYKDGEIKKVPVPSFLQAVANTTH